jgi:hypothetical protein
VLRFLQKHADRILGVLNGFDRLVLRGSLRRLAYLQGMKGFLWDRQILLKDFGDFAQSATERLKTETTAYAEALSRPIIYLASAQTDKERIALEAAKRDDVREGLVCVISCVEPCLCFDVHRNAEIKKLELVMRERKCLHYYHYMIDPVFGWMNARTQTWLPFPVQICMNGREWLARRMDEEGLAYRRADNCFTWIEDFAEAQALMDRQLRTNWPKELGRVAALLSPAQDEILRGPIQRYWTTHQSEWATDLAFRDADSLAAVYPRLLLHGITSFASPDVMRFLGKKLDARFRGEVVSDLRRRAEGVRIKHRVGRNSVKLYDKQGSVLRAETTINEPRAFLVYRPAEGDPGGEKSWRAMRRGLADQHARAQAGQACNERYLDALADVDTAVPLGNLLADVCKPVTWNGKRVRGLRPLPGGDLELLQAIGRGEYAIDGLRNRDLQVHLFKTEPADAADCRRRCAKVTRLLRLLRAHGILHKIPRTHRYKLSPRGRGLAAAVLATQRLTLEQINTLAA